MGQRTVEGRCVITAQMKHTIFSLGVCRPAAAPDRGRPQETVPGVQLRPPARLPGGRRRRRPHQTQETGESRQSFKKSPRASPRADELQTGRGECGDEAGAAESSGVEKKRSADQTEETGGRSSQEDFSSGGRAAEETQEAGRVGERAGGKPESSGVRQSEGESETDVVSQQRGEGGVETELLSRRRQRTENCLQDTLGTQAC